MSVFHACQLPPNRILKARLEDKRGREVTMDSPGVD